jgi:tetratricopeptide (TPR) repeat protein
LHEGAVDIVGEGIPSGVQLKAGQRFDATREGIWKISAATTQPTPSAVNAASAVTANEPSPEVEADETPGIDREIVEPSRHIVTARKEVATSWSHLIAEGKFQQVLNEAQEQGVDGCLRSCSTKDLRALSDAARYKGNTDLARRALLRLRESAPNERARAGYLLGSLAEVQGQSSSALSWYTRYVSEAPGGLLLSEARAGRLRCLLQLGQKAEARKAAIQYLDMYPQGVGEKVARQILKKP